MTTGYCASLERCGIDRTSIDELDVTETILPLRMGWKTESKGSALCRTVSTCCTSALLFVLFASFVVHTSGGSLETIPAAFRSVYERKKGENSESIASEGCTETTRSLARYATRATARKCGQSFEIAMHVKRGVTEGLTSFARC